GLEAMDYIIADRHVLPPGDEPYYCEAPIRLPDSYLCFTPPTDAPPEGNLPAGDAGPITFGCLNNLIKVNDRVITLWTALLARVPASRLLLKTRQLAEQEMQTRIEKAFARHGIAADRLILVGPGLRGDMLAAYQQIDIALDPFPFGGGTTTLEA